MLVRSEEYTETLMLKLVDELLAYALEIDGLKSTQKTLLDLALVLVDRISSSSIKNLPRYSENPVFVKLYILLRRIIRKRIYDEKLFREFIIACTSMND